MYTIEVVYIFVMIIIVAITLCCIFISIIARQIDKHYMIKALEREIIKEKTNDINTSKDDMNTNTDDISGGNDTDDISGGNDTSNITNGKKYNKNACDVSKLTPNPTFSDTFTNVIVDTNNLIYSIDKPTPYNYYMMVVNCVKQLTKVLPNKTIYFVLKDQETIEQEKIAKKIYKVKSIELVYKKIFTGLIKKYPSCRFVLVKRPRRTKPLTNEEYMKNRFDHNKRTDELRNDKNEMNRTGDRYRDDYTVLWVAQNIDSSIVLSRDKYSDFSSMVDKGFSYKLYGKSTNKLKDKLNQPFTYITRKTPVSFISDNTIDKGFYLNNSDHVLNL